MKYYIIAGEASGDIHGGNVVAKIKQLDPGADIRAWGGDNMARAGANIVKHYRDLAFMGFAEVIGHLGTILKNIKACKQDILDFQPEVLLLIDYPGFNLRIAQWARQHGFPVCYYIAPQAWAWNEGRVRKIRKSIDKLFCILPFEPAFFQKHNYGASYIGNPSVEEMGKILEEGISEEDKKWMLEAGDKRIVALLPGSRNQEIKSKLPLMLALIPRFPDCHFIIAKAPSMRREVYDEIIAGRPVSVVDGKMYELLKVAAAAVVTSGTATLETALLGVPQVVCYKTSNLTYRIAKAVAKVKYISLVNLILDKPVVRELIQHDLTITTLGDELDRLLHHQEYQEKMQLDYTHLWETLGTQSASENVATEVVKIAKRNT